MVFMKKRKDECEFIYEWSHVGKLEIKVEGNRCATLQFTPSEEAVKEHLAKSIIKPYNELKK